MPTWQVTITRFYRDDHQEQSVAKIDDKTIPAMEQYCRDQQNVELGKRGVRGVTIAASAVQRGPVSINAMICLTKFK